MGRPDNERDCRFVALVADGTIQLFVPAQIAGMLQETGFTMDLTRVIGPIILACAILYAIPEIVAAPALAILKGSGFQGGAGGRLRPSPHSVSWGRRRKSWSWLLGAMTWGGLYARDPRIRAILPLIR